jgi:hypothetical protein
MPHTPSPIPRRSLLKAATAALAGLGLPGRRSFAGLTTPTKVIPAIKPTTLRRRFYRLLADDRELMGRLPGGFWRGKAPAGSTRPFAVYRDEFTSDGQPAIEFTVYAPNTINGSQICGRAHAVVAASPLEFDGGSAMLRESHRCYVQRGGQPTRSDSITWHVKPVA